MSEVFSLLPTRTSYFWHSKILEFSDRMNWFYSVQEMNERLIQNWNEFVKPGDLIYHLGDFAWKDSEPILRRLNGQKFLIEGNHDSDAKRFKKYWAQITPMKYIKIGDKHITLNHFPMRSWNGSHFGYWHLHGHSHDNMKPYGKSFDIGVDTKQLPEHKPFSPYSFDEIVAKMNMLPEFIEDARYVEEDDENG